MAELRDLLAGGDRRSIGRVPEVVATVQASPALLDELVAAMGDADPVVRMRAADAVEKVTAARPDWLAPYKAQLLGPIAAIPQQEVRWHVAQLLPRLVLEGAVSEADAKHLRQVAVAILFGYLDDRSAIVRSFALDALAQLSADDATLRARVEQALKEALHIGSPAERSRAKRLLAGWDKASAAPGPVTGGAGPDPSDPSDVPSGPPEQPEGRANIITIGGPIDSVKTSLAFYGDDLDPDLVSAILGCQPTVAARKGEPFTGKPYKAVTGVWLLGEGWSSTDTGAQIAALLQRVTSDPAAWERLSSFTGKINCGLTVRDWNRGLELSPGLIQQLAARGLGIGFDIYCDADDEL